MDEVPRGDKAVTAIVARPAANERAFARLLAKVAHDRLCASQARQLHQLLDGKAAFRRHELDIDLLRQRGTQILASTRHWADKRE